MKAGWLELLTIALCVFWLINANRKRRVLHKMEQAVDKHMTSNSKKESSKKTSLDKHLDVEDVDFEVVDE